MNVKNMADGYIEAIREEVLKKGYPIKIGGILSSNDPASISYTEYTKKACESAGIEYELKIVDKDNVKKEIAFANKDKAIAGIFVYYPIYGDDRDDKIKDCVKYSKDIEGLSSYWGKKLEENIRLDNFDNKSLLPCTALSCLKAISMTDVYGDGLPFKGKKIAIFNRSEVVGAPLARMMSNDGGLVYSFDEKGCIEFFGGDVRESSENREVIKDCDVVITGVPSNSFKIGADEISGEAVCLNFSFNENFTEEAKQKSRIYIPKVGPLTIAMCLRNTLRVYKGYNMEVANVKRPVNR